MLFHLPPGQILLYIALAVATIRQKLMPTKPMILATVQTLKGLGYYWSLFAFFSAKRPLKSCQKSRHELITNSCSVVNSSS